MRSEIALFLDVLFLVVAFGWRSWVQYRRTGDIGFRGFSRGASPLERAAGSLFAIALIAFAVLPVCDMLGLIPAAEVLDGAVGQGLGLLLAGSGIAFTVLAQLQMGDSWRIGVDPSEATPLVQHGLFRHVRNPIFSGMLLATLGLALLVPSPLSAAAWVLLAFAVELQVRRVEEPHLLRRHAQAYTEYARKAGRFLPRVGRLA